jgi:hypothetical protein
LHDRQIDNGSPNTPITIFERVNRFKPKMRDRGANQTVNRAGTHFGFSMNGSVFTMKVDGTELKKLTSSNRSVSMGDFSPDGQYILVETNDSPYAAWAVPVSAEKVYVGPSSPNSVVRIRSIEDGAVRNLYPSGSVSWR